MSLMTYLLLSGYVMGTQQRLDNDSIYANNAIIFSLSLSLSLSLSPPLSLSLCLLSFSLPLRFTPEDLGINASSLFAWLAFEIIIVWVALFLFKITSHLSLSDTIAYCSYKYVR